MDEQIKTRFNILFWAVGTIAALVIALLANTITMSYQLGQLNGELTVLLNHVSLK